MTWVCVFGALNCSMLSLHRWTLDKNGLILLFHCHINYRWIVSWAEYVGLFWVSPRLQLHDADSCWWIMFGASCYQLVPGPKNTVTGRGRPSRAIQSVAGPHELFNPWPSVYANSELAACQVVLATMNLFNALIKNCVMLSFHCLMRELVPLGATWCSWCQRPRNTVHPCVCVCVCVCVAG